MELDEVRSFALGNLFYMDGTLTRILKSGRLKVVSHPTHVKLLGKTYRRETVIKLLTGGTLSKPSAAVNFPISDAQRMFFIRCLYRLHTAILEAIGARKEYYVDALVYAVNCFHERMAAAGIHWDVHLYADKGYLNQCSAINRLMPFSDFTDQAIKDLAGWKPVHLTRKRRETAVDVSRRFEQSLRQLPFDCWHVRLAAAMDLLQSACRKASMPRVAKKVVRINHESIFTACDPEALEHALRCVERRVRESAEVREPSPIRKAKADSTFYAAMFGKMLDATKDLHLVDRMAAMEESERYMDDLDIWSPATHRAFGCNHMFMAMNEKGMLKPFVEYFGRMSVNRRLFATGRSRRARRLAVRNAGKVMALIKASTTKRTRHFSLDIIRAVRRRLDKSILASPAGALDSAVATVAEDMKSWKTLQSLRNHPPV